MTAVARRYLVTAALPYANNVLHLGHIAGVYLPADTYVRFLRLMGEDVVFICGSDDFGVPVTISAQKEKLTPVQVVERYHELQRQVFEQFQIRFDIYSGTSTCPLHRAAAQEMFTRIRERGRLVERDLEQFYCPSCRRFLPDRYVEGTCPVCGAPGARGDQCDTCGRDFETLQLVNPKCATCGSTPETRPSHHWFFKLDEFAPQLESWLAGQPHWRENVRNFSLGLVREGLEERCITRDLTWGVPVPLAAAGDKVLYVWFDAPIGYISFTQELFAARGEPDGWRRYWANPDAQVVHFLGKDNIIFHAVMWPAMLLAHGEYNLPANIPANEYLNYNGAKFSKSRGIGVTAAEALAQYPVDRLRYYLTAVAPEGRDSNYNEVDLVQRNNDELSDVLGNLCHRVHTFHDKHFGGVVPPGVAADPRALELLARIRDTVDRWRARLEECRFRDALAAVIELAREGNRAFDAAEPWKTRKSDPTRCALDLGAFLELVHALGVMLLPFLPELAQKIVAPTAGGATMDAARVRALGTRPLLAPGARIVAPGIIFPRLEVLAE